jgi:ubiquinone/menaquinone biosynthesis C-methylase UbiE
MDILFNKLTPSNHNLKNYLVRKINNHLTSKDCYLLEVGCADGRFASLLHNEVSKYFGIDIDEEYIKIAQKNLTYSNVEFKHGNALDIPYLKKFDIILYAFAWHFFPDFEKALKEADRVLSDRGLIAVIEPTQDGARWADPKLNRGDKEFDEDAHKRKIYQLERAEKALREQNLFKIVEEDYNLRRIPNIWILKRELK